MKVAAIIPAAGSGRRMGGASPKQYLALEGLPILVRSLRPFLSAADIALTVVVAPPERLESTRDLCREFLGTTDRLRMTAGGATRQDSVRAGLSALPPDIDLVAVHDGARPLVRAQLIRDCIAAALRDGAAIAAVPLADTLKRAGEHDTVVATVPRDGLWRAQTPQVARRDWLEQAYAQAAREDFQGTDEAALLERAGFSVTLVASDDGNIKITRPEDLPLAEALVRSQKSEDRGQKSEDRGQEPGREGLRVGHGYDAHRLVAGRPLVLGGVTIPHPRGLDGHSDADVLVHALMDALLGALGLGDIGRHFPDSDPALRGIDSMRLLERVMALMAQRDGRLCNADLTIICQTPKLASHIPAMRECIARACAVLPSQINIKATTTEKMGFCGRGEGIAAHAVVLLALSSPADLSHDH